MVYKNGDSGFFKLPRETEIGLKNKVLKIKEKFQKLSIIPLPNFYLHAYLNQVLVTIYNCRFKCCKVV